MRDHSGRKSGHYLQLSLEGGQDSVDSSARCAQAVYIFRLKFSALLEAMTLTNKWLCKRT